MKDALSGVVLFKTDAEKGEGKELASQYVVTGYPTFVLVNVYRRTDGERFAHLDAYRLSGSGEADALDLDELMGGGPLVVEWAPRIQEALPEENLLVRLEWVEDEHRRMRFSANGDYYQDLLDDFQKSMLGGA